MPNFLPIGFAFLVLNILVGIVANGFIVFFICVDWFQSRKLSPTDLILCCLGLSRCLLQMIVILNTIIRTFFNHVYLQSNTKVVISSVWLFINTVNLWFAAWLSVLYFVKVAIFSHPVFLQMKQRFSGLVPWLLLSSVIFCAAVAVITGTISAYVFSICFSYLSLSSNSSDPAIQSLHFCGNFPNLFIAPHIIPFMLFLTPSIFLISSLWKHIKCLQNNGIGAKDLNTQVHLTVIKALASFAVLYLFNFVAVILQLTQSHDDSWITTVFENVGALYPSGHAIILILINPKLKQGWVRMLHHFKCHLSKAPS